MFLESYYPPAMQPQPAIDLSALFDASALTDNLGPLELPASFSSSNSTSSCTTTITTNSDPDSRPQPHSMLPELDLDTLVAMPPYNSSMLAMPPVVSSFSPQQLSSAALASAFAAAKLAAAMSINAQALGSPSSVLPDSAIATPEAFPSSPVSSASISGNGSSDSNLSSAFSLMAPCDSDCGNDAGDASSVGECDRGGDEKASQGEEVRSGLTLEEVLIRSAPTASEEERLCLNCWTTDTPLWRRDDCGRALCNACGLYLKTYGINRPLKAVRAAAKAPRSRKPRIIDSSENLVCNNCKSKDTSLWRRGGVEGKELLCNACGLYYKLHKVHRSQDLACKGETKRRSRKWMGSSSRGGSAGATSATGRLSPSPYPSLTQPVGAGSPPSAAAFTPSRLTLQPPRPSSPPTTTTTTATTVSAPHAVKDTSSSPGSAVSDAGVSVNPVSATLAGLTGNLSQVQAQAQQQQHHLSMLSQLSVPSYMNPTMATAAPLPMWMMLEQQQRQQQQQMLALAMLNSMHMGPMGLGAAPMGMPAPSAAATHSAAQAAAALMGLGGLPSMGAYASAGNVNMNLGSSPPHHHHQLSHGLHGSGSQASLASLASLASPTLTAGTHLSQQQQQQASPVLGAVNPMLSSLFQQHQQQIQHQQQQIQHQQQQIEQQRQYQAFGVYGGNNSNPNASAASADQQGLTSSSALFGFGHSQSTAAVEFVEQQNNQLVAPPSQQELEEVQRKVVDLEGQLNMLKTIMMRGAQHPPN